MGIEISRELPSGSGQRFDLAEMITPQVLTQMTGERYDSAQTALFLRDLTEAYSKTFDFKFPNLKAMSILPVWSGIDPAADGFVWRAYEHLGQAAFIDDYAADLPSTDEKGTENMSRLYSLGASYNYSIMDLKKAQRTGLPIETRKAFNARRAIEQAVEQIAFFGGVQNPDTTANAQAIRNAPSAQSSTDNLQMYGLTNFPGLLGGGGSGSTANATTNDWTNPATAVTTIVNDWTTQVNGIRTDTKGTHDANMVVMPLSLHAFLSTKPRSATFTEDNLLSYLLKMTPQIKRVEWSTMLEFAGKKQDTTTPGSMVLFGEFDNDNLELVLPGGFEQLPPQMVNLTFKIPCHRRVGGVRVSYPKAFRALNGAQG